MKEIVEQYGPLFEFWWDGANGEGPNGKKQVYDFAKFENTLRTIAPNTVIFSDIGPDLRWVGNENGIAGITNWNLLDTAGFKRGIRSPPVDTLKTGNEKGRNWIPAECDVSIRPGWFYHKQEDSLVKNPEALFQLYLKSVGRGASLLLNVPPDRRGLINAHDSMALVGFKKLREESFSDNLAKKGRAFLVSPKGNRAAPNINDGLDSTREYISFTRDTAVGIFFDRPVTLNCIVLKEYLKEGQSCKKFRVLFMNEKRETVRVIQGNTIGHKRIISFPTLQTNLIYLIIDDQKTPTGISELEVYRISDSLVEKTEN